MYAYILILILICIIVYAYKHKCSHFKSHGGGRRNEDKSYKNIYYIVHNNCSIDSTFVPSVEIILNNSDWKRHGYRFLRLENNKHRRNDITHIYLCRREDLDKFHKKKKYYPNGTQIRYSFTVGNAPGASIYIDGTNWVNGVPQSGLDIEKYRTYVINHEMGHALGYDHQKCDSTTAIDGICPVMYQSTVGPPPGFASGFQPNPSDITAFI